MHDLLEVNDSIGTLTSSGNIIRSAPKDFKKLAADATIDSYGITIPRYGLYDVCFGLVHCGSNGLTKVNASWQATLIKANTSNARTPYDQTRGIVKIPVGGTWDAVSPVHEIYELEADIYYGKFTNLSGGSTSVEYNSRVVISAVWVPYL